MRIIADVQWLYGTSIFFLVGIPVCHVDCVTEYIKEPKHWSAGVKGFKLHTPLFLS